MKKILSVVVSLLIVFALTACSSNSTTDESANVASETESALEEQNKDFAEDYMTMYYADLFLTAQMDTLP